MLSNPNDPTNKNLLSTLDQKNFRFSGSEIVTVPLTPFSSSAQNEEVLPTYEDFDHPGEKYQKAMEFLGMRKIRDKSDLRNSEA